MKDEGLTGVMISRGTLHALLALVERLRKQSGGGALPLKALPVPDPRSDEQLIVETTKAVQVLYERQKQIQDGAGVVAGLLGQTVGAGAGESQGPQAAARRAEQT